MRRVSICQLILLSPERAAFASAESMHVGKSISSVELRACRGQLRQSVLGTKTSSGRFLPRLMAALAVEKTAVAAFK